MRNPGGFTFLTDGDTGRITEGESFTCQHCNKIEFVKPFENPENVGGRCKVCMGLICPRCSGNMSLGGRCTPLMKKIEEELEIITNLRAQGVL